MVHALREGSEKRDDGEWLIQVGNREMTTVSVPQWAGWYQGNRAAQRTTLMLIGFPMRRSSVVFPICRSLVVFPMPRSFMRRNPCMQTAAARYGAIRALSSMLTPALMAWVAADLLLKATGTDYGRVVRAIFALAQIRLVRTYGFTQGRPDQIEEAREGF